MSNLSPTAGTNDPVRPACRVGVNRRVALCGLTTMLFVGCASSPSQTSRTKGAATTKAGGVQSAAKTANLKTPATASDSVAKDSQPKTVKQFVGMPQVRLPADN